MRPVLLLLFAAAVPAGDEDPDPPREKALLSIDPPGDGKHLPTSVPAVLEAARACIANGHRRDVPETSTTDVTYFTARKVDGKVPEPTMRSVEWRCESRPVTRCRFQYAWDDGISELSYATVECSGSYDDPEASYTVTSVVDVPDAARPANGTPRGHRAVSVSYAMTAFPGTQVNAWAQYRRSDGGVEGAVRIQRFDNFSAMGEQADDSLEPDGVRFLSRRIEAVACEGVGRKECARK